VIKVPSKDGSKDKYIQLMGSWEDSLGNSVLVVQGHNGLPQAVLTKKEQINEEEDGEDGEGSEDGADGEELQEVDSRGNN
jgi:hypothetical protein